MTDAQILSPILYVIWAITLVLLGFIAYQLGVSSGIRKCRGFAAKLHEAHMNGTKFDPRKIKL